MRPYLVGFGFVLILATFFWAHGPDQDELEESFYRKFGDAFDRKVRSMGGSGFLNCGRMDFSANQSPDELNACAEKALKTRTPFYLRYDSHGIDSRIAYGVLANDRHEFYQLHFDGDPMGQGGISFRRQKAWANRCIGDEFVIGQRNRIECSRFDWRKPV